MNIREAKQEIVHAVQAYLEKDETGAYMIPPERQRPLLLMGPPGIGKTAIMEQVAQECGIGLVSYTITHHTRQSAIGLPFISKKEYGGRSCSVTEYTMSEIVASVYDQIEASGLKEGILFLDEINCVSETLAPTMLQFLQYKTFGAHRVPDGFLIVTAGNPPQYNKSVREFDIVTLDRLRRIDIEEDLAAFREYASRAGVHGSIMAYLGIRADHFYSIRTELEGRHFVTARGWEDLSRTIQVHEKCGLPVDEKLASQFLQDPEIARSFASYYDLYNKYCDIYSVPEILSGRFRVEGYGEKESGEFGDKDGRQKFLFIDALRVQEMQTAPFDEKLSLISLLIDALSRLFSDCAREKAVQKILVRELAFVRKELKELESRDSKENTGMGSSAALSGTSDAGRQAAGIVEDRSAFLRRTMNRRKEAGLPVSKEDERTGRLACMALDSLGRLLRESWLKGSADVTAQDQSGIDELPDSAPAKTPAEQYALIREWFSSREEERQKSIGRADASLTNAFRFLSLVYGDGQEMVLFLTELSSGYHSLQFLNEHGNEEYFRYNRLLLLREKRDGLREEVLRLME